MVLKELNFNSFFIGRVWWTSKNWFLTVDTLGGCGGLERNHFKWLIPLGDVVVLKELIFKSFYLGMV